MEEEENLVEGDVIINDQGDEQILQDGRWIPYAKVENGVRQLNLDSKWQTVPEEKEQAYLANVRAPKPERQTMAEGMVGGFSPLGLVGAASAVKGAGAAYKYAKDLPEMLSILKTGQGTLPGMKATAKEVLVEKMRNLQNNPTALIAGGSALVGAAGTLGSKMASYVSGLFDE